VIVFMHACRDVGDLSWWGFAVSGADFLLFEKLCLKRSDIAYV